MGYNKQAGFSNEGFRVRRKGPDGVKAGVERQVGFTGSIILPVGALDLLYRLNGENGSWTTISVDISSASSGALADVISALNSDGNYGAVFTAEEITVANGYDADDPGLGRLNNKLTTVGSNVDLEMKGALAELLQLGSYIEHESQGIGTQWFNVFAGSGAIGLPKNVKDFEEIEVESGSGDLFSMIIDAIVKGINPTIGLIYEDYEIKQCIQGGTLVTTGDYPIYTPPGTSDSYLPLTEIEVYQPKYRSGSNRRSGNTYYKRLVLNNVQGRETDLTEDIKAWAAYGFDCRATEGVLATGTKEPAWYEHELTTAQFSALSFPNV